MSIPTNRWYIKDKITIADRTSTFKTLELTDSNFAALVTKADAEESSVYQIILKDSLAGVAESDLYDPSRFDNADFVSELRSRAALTYLSTTGISKSDLMFGKDAAHVNILKLAYDSTLITKRFYIDTGAAKAGAVISFQVYLITSIAMQNAISDIAFGEVRQEDAANAAEGTAPPTANNIATAASEAAAMSSPLLPTEESWMAMPLIKRFPINEHLPAISEMLPDEVTHLSNLSSMLRQAKTKNERLEEKYEIDFDSLAADIKEFQNTIEAAYFDQLRQALWTKWAQILKVEPNEMTVEEQQKWLLPVREGIEYRFNIGTEPETGDTIEFARICAYLPPPDDATEAEEKSKGYNFEEQGVVIIGKEVLNEAYNTTIIFLIYNSQLIWSFLKVKGYDWDIDEFVENFIRPVETKGPKPLESVAVSNTTTDPPVYKTTEDLREEILSPEQKVAVHKEVVEKYNQVGDPGFINMLQNNTNIKSTEDVYKYILNVVPLDSLMTLAAQCMQKFIPELDLRSKVCDTILRNLSLDQLDKIFDYMGYNPNEALTDLHNKIWADAESSVGLFSQNAKTKKPDGSPSALFKKHLRMTLRDKWRNNIEAKDIICLAVFAAIPEALSLLSSLDSSSALESIIKKQFAEQKKAAMGKLLDEYNQGIGKIGSMTGIDQKKLNKWASSVGAKDHIKNFDLSKLSKTKMPTLPDGKKSSSGGGWDWGWGDSSTGENKPGGKTTSDSPAESKFKKEMDEKLKKQLKKVEKDIEAKLKKRLKSEKEKALAKLEKFTNPSKMLFDAFNNTLMGFSVTSITGDMVKTLMEVILKFVDEFVTQLILQIVEEIAYMCEGSSKADFANMGTPDENTEFPADVEPIYPLDPTVISDVVTDPSVYDDLHDFLTTTGDREIARLVQDFLDDLGKLLTLSEICALLDKNASAATKKVIYNKIWFGILNLEHYAPLKKALKNIANLKKFFYILSAKVSKKRCVDKLNKLQNTKKLLSNLCGPLSNQALIDDLKGKASDAAIAQLLNQEDEIMDNLLDAMHKVKNSEPPPLFCGPGTDNKDKKPVFKSQLHASEKHVNDKMLDSILGAITTSFEKDVGFYKSILTTAGGKTYQDAAKQITGAMASTYEIKNLKTGATKDALNAATAVGKIVAPKVHNTLTSAGKSISVESSEGSATNNDVFIHITTEDTINGSDVIDLKLNFGSKENNEIPPETSRLEFGFALANENYDIEPVKIDNVLQASVVGPTKMINSVVNTFDPQNAYDALVKTFVTSGADFYALLLEQIIKEHAEYASTQGLFQRSVFEELALTKKDLCDHSLLGYKKLLKQIPANAEAMQCKIDIKSSPSAYEIAQINGFVELSIKVVVIQEFLKSLMVFSAFGIEALLPETGKEDSFYYKYLYNQVFKSLKNSIKTYLWKFSRIVYATNYDKEVKQVPLEEVAREIIGRHIVEIQTKIADKLAALPDNTDYNKNIGGTAAKTKGVLEEEFLQSTGNVNSRQIMRNLVPTAVFKPPEILDVDINNQQIVIPNKFYSGNKRLKNGGFFIEEGIEVIPKWKGDDGAFNGLAFQEDHKTLRLKLVQKSAELPASSLDAIIANSAIGEFIFLTDSSKTPAYKKTYKWLSHKEIKDYSTKIGKLPKTNVGNYTFAFWNSDAILAEYNVFISGASVLGQSSADNKFYKKLSSYRSLNVLIPVVPGSLLEAKHNALKKSAYAGADYYDAVLDRKYFLEEDGTGKKYFKLPILTFYGNKSAVDSVGDLQANKSMVDIFNEFEEELNAPMYPEDPNSITILKHLQNVFEQESAVKKALNDALVDLDKEIIADVGFKASTASSAKKYPGSYNNDKFNALPGQLMHKDKRGIWGIINSRPVGDSKKPGIYPNSHSEIPNQPMVRQYINFETGEKWNKEGWKKTEASIEVAANKSAGWKGNTAYKAFSVDKGGGGGTNVVAYYKYSLSNKTNMGVPISAQEPLGHSYWNGKYWLSVGEDHFAEKLQEIWNILHKFNTATLSNQEKYYWYQPGQNISKAYEKLALLEQLRDMKITAKLDPKMYLHPTDQNPISAPQDGGWGNKEYPMFLDIDSPNKGYNEFSTGAWVNHDGNPRGVQWTKRSKIQEMINLYSNKTTKTDENGKTTHHWFGLASDEWRYEKDIKSIEALMSQTLFDVLIPTMANDPRFKDFTQSIQYKSLLSFLSILVAETVESEYGQLRTMFKGTLNTIQTALNTFATTANRSKDPEFYQKTGQAPGEDPAPAESFELDFNWMPIILKAFFTTMADMTDPTWTTPWFWPGPLTPIGVMAKILDGKEDTDNPNSMKQVQLKNKLDTPSSEECEEEEEV